MRILIDADGCPVVDETVLLANKIHAECIILCDTSHQIEREGAKTLICSKGPDSVDFTLINLVNPGDIVVTQDYGLAAMCLARSARVINQNGMEYTNDNIDGYLLQRYFAKRMRGSHHKRNFPRHHKRKKEQNNSFSSKLKAITNQYGKNKSTC